MPMEMVEPLNPRWYIGEPAPLRVDDMLLLSRGENNENEKEFDEQSSDSDDGN